MLQKLDIDSLWNILELEETEPLMKEKGLLIHNAMENWPSSNVEFIEDFIKEIKTYFGNPLKFENIMGYGFSSNNAWQLEASEFLKDLDCLCAKENNLGLDRNLDLIIKYFIREFNRTDFTATLKYLSSEEGGRQHYAESGYRPQVKFEFDLLQTSGQQTFIGTERVFPGETVRARLKIISTDHFYGRLESKIPFKFLEGNKLIGTGVIEAMVNSKLEQQ